MKQLTKALFFPLVLVAIVACEPAPKKLEATNKDPKLAKQTAGVYTGEVPCADCEAIAYKLALKPDFTYEAEMVYKGKSEEAQALSGSYAFTEDSILVLEKIESGMNYFKLGEAGLTMLDQNGEVIAGDLADQYKLMRMDRATPMKAMAEQDNPDAQLKNDMMRKLQAEGVDFYAAGNEPFWNVRIDFEKKMVFNPMEGEPMSTPAVEGALAMDADPPRIRYGAEVESGNLIVEIISEECTDNMSGEKFTHRVQVDIRRGTDQEYTTYEGCGRYVTDYDLAGTWELQEMAGEAVDGSQLQKGTPVLTFMPEVLRVSGHAGCNQMTGAYTMEKKAIHFGNMASTMMACPDMDLEQAFAKMVNGRILEYELEGDQLILTHPSGKTLVYKKKA